MIQLVESLMLGLDSSLINRCREREMLKAGLTSGSLGFTLWAQDDNHGLPKDVGSSPEDSVVPFDAFQVMRDLYFGNKGDRGDSFACRDVTWWSPEVRMDYRV